MMKRKITALIVALAILEGGTAFAAGGSANDPLLSQEYINGTYKNSLMNQIAAQVETVFSGIYQKADQRLAAEAETYRKLLSGNSSSSGWSYHHQLTSEKYSLRDKIILQSGASFLLMEGAASAIGEGGELIDATTGTSANAMDLSFGHRYLAGENATVTVTVQSDAAFLSSAGYYKVQKSGVVAMPFVDVPQNQWYYDSVRFVYEQKYFNGVSADHFDPGSPLSRAMLATLLHRVAGEPAPQEEGASFTDVLSNLWYSRGIQWASSVGIVNGMGDGTFRPDSNITREDLATMLYRYTQEYLKTELGEAGELSQFKDHNQISSWATEALAWAVGIGIMKGDTDGTLRPGASASRAEAAAMIQRFINLLP